MSTSEPGQPAGSVPEYPFGTDPRYPAPAEGPPGAYQPGGPAAPSPLATCAFHAGRGTALHCTRCGRPACPECLTPAAVGFQCRACMAENRITRRTAAGGRLRQQPRVTLALIAVNVIVFVITAIQARTLSAPYDAWVFQQSALVPDTVAGGQWWRLITSGFLHFGLVHIATNMISLYVLGAALERILGGSRFLVVYALSLLGGSALVLLAAPSTGLEAGASGAIFGLLGAIVVVHRKLKLDLRQVMSILVINLIITFSVPGLSWQGHIGGLVVGAAAGAIMLYPPQQVRRQWQVGGSLGLLGLVVVTMVAYAVIHHPEFCGVDGQYFLRCAG